MPLRETKNLTARLRKATLRYKKAQENVEINPDDAFKMVFVPEDESDQLNPYEIRDAFFEFVSHVMKNYQKFLLTPNDQLKTIEVDNFFNFKGFRNSKDNGSKENSFIYQFTATGTFYNFIEA